MIMILITIILMIILVIMIITMIQNDDNNSSNNTSNHNIKHSNHNSNKHRPRPPAAEGRPRTPIDHRAILSYFKLFTTIKGNLSYFKPANSQPA